MKKIISFIQRLFGNTPVEIAPVIVTKEVKKAPVVKKVVKKVKKA